MYFDSLSSLWHMDGHGLYVWVSYGVTALLLAAMVRLPISRFHRHWEWVKSEQLRRVSAEPSGAVDGQKD